MSTEQFSVCRFTSFSPLNTLLYCIAAVEAKKAGTNNAAGSAETVEEGEHMQRALKEGTIEEVLKSLEEIKAEAIKRVNAFYDTAKAVVDDAEKEIAERIEWRHNTAFEAVTEVLKKIQETNELTEDLKEEALHALEEYFIEYNARNNSEFVFLIVKELR